MGARVSPAADPALAVAASLTPFRRLGAAEDGQWHSVDAWRILIKGVL